MQLVQYTSTNIKVPATAATVDRVGDLSIEAQYSSLEERDLTASYEDATGQAISHVADSGSHALDINPPQPLSFSGLQPRSRENYRILQKWEGYVTEVEIDVFHAVLSPIVGGGPDLDTEIYIEEVVSGDRHLIEPGAVFYLSIGYLDRPSGRQRVLLLRFRRLPRWSERDIEDARELAEKLGKLFD